MPIYRREKRNPFIARRPAATIYFDQFAGKLRRYRLKLLDLHQFSQGMCDGPTRLHDPGQLDVR